MKLVSWNVNGIRACIKKGFMDFFDVVDADIICLQETKIQEDQNIFDMDGYFCTWNYAEKKGYSGTAVLSKIKPLITHTGADLGLDNTEGRVICNEYTDFYLVNVYTPNSKRELERLSYRQKWEDEFRVCLCALKMIKPVVLCGDLNVAHNEIDLKNPSRNRRSPGFTDEEREKFSDLLKSGFIDTFRYLYPDLEEVYSWWSYMGNARANNVGWRIDYFLVSECIKHNIVDAKIHMDVYGSDHCPVELVVSSFER